MLRTWAFLVSRPSSVDLTQSFVSFRPSQGDLLVRINRRGANRHRFRSEVPRREIETLIQDLRDRSLKESELSTAKREAATKFARPPYTHRSEAYLSDRARFLAASTCCGWPTELASEMRAVTAQQVAKIFEIHLSPERLAWFELLPTARPDDLPPGWR